jgi:uncharacterized protein (TIGR02118 family)
MSAAILVIYDGTPDDPEAFLHYYVERHVPIVWTLPLIRGIVLDGCLEGDIFLIARFLFDSAEDARAALQSPQRERALTDQANFPSFTGKVRHQVVEVVEVPMPTV